jgi:hypothetical protein
MGPSRRALHIEKHWSQVRLLRKYLPIIRDRACVLDLSVDTVAAALIMTSALPMRPV